MAGLSIHVVDVARGVPAAGMRVEVWRLGAASALLADAATGADGSLPLPGLHAASLERGVYQVLFHVAQWCRAQELPLADPPFLDVVPFRFAVADPAQHYHLPLKFTPWGVSLFRGGG